MADRVRYTFQLYNRFTPAARAIQRSTASIRQQFRLLSAETKQLRASMLAAGRGMKTASLYATVAIGGSLKAFGDLEQGVYNVYTLLDDDSAMRAYGDRIRGLSEDAIRMGFATQDSNKALFDAVSALGAGERTWNAYQAAQKLAVAGVTEISVATDGLTSIMNAYGKEARNAEHVANAFFSAQKAGKTTVAELANNIGKVAPIAKTAGVSYQELLATTAQLTLGGLSTEEATTSLRQAIAALVKPTSEAERVFKQLRKRGIEIPFGATALRATGLGRALQQLAKVGEEFPDLMAEAIPNIRAFTGIAALGEEQIANIDRTMRRINLDIETGTGMQAAFVLQQSSFNQEMKRTWGYVRILASRIGEAVAPVVKVLGFALRSLIAFLDALGPVVGKAFGAILGIVAAAAPILLFFGKFGAAVKLVGTAMAGTLGTVLFIVGGIGAGLYTIIKYWDELKKVDLGATWRYVKDWFSDGAEELNVSGSVSQASKARVDINMRAPKGTVESTKVRRTGEAPALAVGINMAEAY